MRQSQMEGHSTKYLELVFQCAKAMTDKIRGDEGGPIKSTNVQGGIRNGSWNRERTSVENSEI